jgi:hypothetical protein
MKVTGTFVLLSWTVFLAGCGNGGSSNDAAIPDAPGPSPSCLEAANHSDFAWIHENILDRSCANFTSCHDRTQPAGNLDLKDIDDAHANLVGPNSTYFTDWERVLPGDCDNSYIMVRLRCHSETMPNGMSCAQGPLDGGDLMPPNSAPLCMQKVDAICRWINEGALRDPPATLPALLTHAAAPSNILT